MSCLSVSPRSLAACPRGRALHHIGCMARAYCLFVNIPYLSVGGLVLLIDINLIVKMKIFNPSAGCEYSERHAGS